MASKLKRWTLDELDRLPDDGNRYELVDGQLFVTPAPAPAHEELAAELTRILDPFVALHGLGRVYRPRAVIRAAGSEVEPDVMVRAPAPRARDWSTIPLPILVVEIVSPTTRRRDYGDKRALYSELGIAEYWIVDAEQRTITVVRGGSSAAITGQLEWKPRAARDVLRIDVRELFANALG